MQDLDDLHEWVDLHLEGDSRAFEAIYDLTIGQVYKLVYFLSGGNRAEVEDIVQEVYTGLFRFMSSYDRSRAFDKWLNGIVVRQVSAHRRRKWRFARLIEKAKRFESEEVTDFSGSVIDQVSNEQLLIHINQLPFKLKSVIILHYLNDYSHTEVAAVLDIPLGTVKSRLNAGLGKLRKKQLLGQPVLGRLGEKHGH